MSFDSVGSDEVDEMKLYLGKYVGDRNEKDERHGYGETLLPNGDEYQGEYQNGKRHGMGKYTFVKGRARYEGEYVEDLRSGQGIFWYPDGSVYEGAWATGERNGYGVYTYINGDIYKGEWKDGRRHGHGEYIYKGNWSNGKFEDEGKLITPNYTYTGTFTGEEPVGPGRFHFDTGCEQEGEYVTKREVRRTNNMREVVHVPVWRCLSLYDARPRVTTPPNEI
ncbi:radial spoke head 1 homolog isoform X2 [Oculina patagonica]